MFTGILTVCCLYSLYTSAVHATDSHFDSATHIGQSCDGQFVLTPSRSDCRFGVSPVNYPDPGVESWPAW